MPELPDITVYVEALERHVQGHALTGVQVVGPSLLRTVDPPVTAAVGERVEDVTRIGKRLVFAFANDVRFVLHLMIAGRLRWKKPGTRLTPRTGLAAFHFAHGTLVLTEASSRKRASLHVVNGEAALAAFDPGGVEPLDVDTATFHAALTRENRTLKRALTDPRLVSGIGNAYSDEILHASRLSPVTLARRLTDDEVARLHAATRDVLTTFTERLRAEVGSKFPDKVTAFRKDFAMHGKYQEPCPECGAPVQRIRYADKETNYCAPCQTGGKLLADRGLSTLLKKDWPRTLEALEEKMGGDADAS